MSDFDHLYKTAEKTLEQNYGYKFEKNSGLGAKVFCRREEDAEAEPSALETWLETAKTDSIASDLCVVLTYRDHCLDEDKASVKALCSSLNVPGNIVRHLFEPNRSTRLQASAASGPSSSSSSSSSWESFQIYMSYGTQPIRDGTLAIGRQTNSPGFVAIALMNKGNAACFEKAIQKFMSAPASVAALPVRQLWLQALFLHEDAAWWIKSQSKIAHEVKNLTSSLAKETAKLDMTASADKLKAFLKTARKAVTYTRTLAAHADRIAAETHDGKLWDATVEMALNTSRTLQNVGQDFAILQGDISFELQQYQSARLVRSAINQSTCVPWNPQPQPAAVKPPTPAAKASEETKPVEAKTAEKTTPQQAKPLSTLANQKPSRSLFRSFFGCFMKPKNKRSNGAPSPPQEPPKKVDDDTSDDEDNFKDAKDHPAEKK